ncbi:MAG: helix-turn-helix transcriptional regulator [Prevotella sp.]|jgi:predicted DNA-binding transcriptional regulator YafY
MATNKNAQIRYRALDRCLSNWSRRYYIDDLVKACNDALYLYNGQGKKEDGVKKRQVQEDLKFMESEEGYRMVIDAIRDGHKKYYRYHHRNDSISERPFNQEEQNIVSDALMLLKRFEGVPQFDWLKDIDKKLYSTSQLGKDVHSVVSFQHNPYLKGMDEDYYKQVFDAIVNKQALEICYHPFGQEPKELAVSPYHLKQYNNRWFLIGKQGSYDGLTNYAIDRIAGIRELGRRKFEPLDEDFDFDEFFEDVVGVSVEDVPVEDVVIYANEKAFNYIFTKPLHESQVTKRELLPDGRREIDLKVKDNYELRALLRSFGSQIEVIKPESLRNKMKENALALSKMYGDKD